MKSDGVDECTRSPNGADSTYKPGPGGVQPRHMYIHLIPEKHQDKTEVYLFSLPNPAQGIQLQGIKDAVAAIENGAAKGKKVKPGSFEVEWRILSYMVYVLKSAKIKLNEVDGITFHQKDTSNNHTFFDGYYLGTWDGLYSAMCCTNYRLNPQGEALGDLEYDEYRWCAHHEPRTERFAKLKILEHTSTGSNTGP
jgi:hypothetical protein